LENGYIVPGIGNSIKTTHGAAYGIGVYSSPFFGKSVYYTIPDKMKYIYILINMVFPGKMKMIAPNNRGGNHKPINGSYENDFNTKIVFGLEQLVCADPERVVPLAIMKIKIC